MKFLRYMFLAALMSLPLAAVAQQTDHAAMAAKPAAAPSAAKKSFEQMKTVEGVWEGILTTTPKSEADGLKADVTLKVTSMGNAMVHEMRMDGRKDDPITMFY